MSRAARRSSAAPALAVLNFADVHARVASGDGKRILRGVNLAIGEGEVHAVMGPNGSGKSTLAKVLIGDPQYEVTGGRALFCGQDLLAMAPHERALSGLFLAFQSPPAVDGVSNLDLLHATYNAQRRSCGEDELDVIGFYNLASAKIADLKIDPAVLSRNVNEGFSGGERKRNEMLQMAILEPKVAILDEIDSGLDVDALKLVAGAIRDLKRADPKRSFLIVTHFDRFLQYVNADFVHVMQEGRIVKSGGRELAQRLDGSGYDWLAGELKQRPMSVSTFQ